MKLQRPNGIVQSPMYAELPDNGGKNQRRNKRDWCEAGHLNLSGSLADQTSHVAQTNAAHLNRQATNASVTNCSFHVTQIKPEESRRHVSIKHFLVGAIRDLF